MEVNWLLPAKQLVFKADDYFPTKHYLYFEMEKIGVLAFKYMYPK